MSIIFFLVGLFALPVLIEVVVLVHDILIKDLDRYWGDWNETRNKYAL